MTIRDLTKLVASALLASAPLILAASAQPLPPTSPPRSSPRSYRQHMWWTC
jgi:hypothetical protein